MLRNMKNLRNARGLTREQGKGAHQRNCTRGRRTRGGITTKGGNKGNNNQGNNNQNNQVPICNTCGKAHSDVCWRTTNGCFRCGEMGHIKRDCPKMRLGANVVPLRSRIKEREQNEEKARHLL